VMNDFILYLLKVVLFHCICYLVYWTGLRKSNYFSLNRVYLLCTLILGFVVPVVTLPLTVLPVDQVIPGVNLSGGQFLEADSSSAINSSAQDSDEYFTVFDMAALIYIAGVLILLLRSALSIRLICRIKARGVETVETTPKVITIKEPMSFSFIDTIILQESASHPVFLHEKCHVLGKHWLDLFIAEIVCTFCWMNPVVWLYRKSLKQQHEYLADDYVLHHGVSQEEYLMCLLNSLSFKDPVGPVHKFNSQSLKQRICMMTKEKLLPYQKLVYISIVPIVALLFLSFSGSKDAGRSADTAKVFVIDAAHGGDDAGGTSSTAVTEKQIALSVARLVQEIGKAKGLNILLTRAGDQTLSLNDRIVFSTEAKADVFLSLHLGFDAGGVHKGVGMYVSEKNVKYSESKRIASLLSKELSDIEEFRSPQVVNFDALVLKQNHAASAIVEVGYLSHEQDVKFMSDPVNQQRIAKKIVTALMKY